MFIVFIFVGYGDHRDLHVRTHSFPTRRSSDLNNYHPFVEEQSIIPKTTLITGYAEGSYELTDEVEAFGEFLFNRRKTYQNGWRQFWNFGFTGDIYNTGNAIGAGTIWAPGWVGYNFVSPTGITKIGRAHV